MRERVNHPLVELTLLRVREFIREPEALFWVFFFPILMACALGIAFRETGPAPVKVAVETSGERTAEIARLLATSPEMDIEQLSKEDAAFALRTGRVAVVVAVDGQGGVVYRYDPVRPDSRAGRLSVDDALQRASGRKDLVAASDKIMTERGARYIDWLIPGLIGMNLMGSGMWGIGFNIVMTRKAKLLKRLSATPMRRGHYLGSFILSRFVFLTAEVVAVLLFAAIFFGVEIRGSYFSTAFVAILGGFAFTGLGLLVASRPRTLEGVSGLMNFVMLPMWLLSGTFFSSERFPAVMQPFIKILPLTALNDSLRAVINEGQSLLSVGAPLIILAVWLVGSFAIALRIFRWQ